MLNLPSLAMEKVCQHLDATSTRNLSNTCYQLKQLVGQCSKKKVIRVETMKITFLGGNFLERSVKVKVWLRAPQYHEIDMDFQPQPFETSYQLHEISMHRLDMRENAEKLYDVISNYNARHLVLDSQSACIRMMKFIPGNFLFNYVKKLSFNADQRCIWQHFYSFVASDGSVNITLDRAGPRATKGFTRAFSCFLENLRAQKLTCAVIPTLSFKEIIAFVSMNKVKQLVFSHGCELRDVTRVNSQKFIEKLASHPHPGLRNSRRQTRNLNIDEMISFSIGEDHDPSQLEMMNHFKNIPGVEAIVPIF
ncbi:unnamed protein product [Caenorhabditis auriculariae]|uniref:F-box domain-containing protein n=1 Tax=Caenorhabditis auriculariae TaxID=2777116 RepID=A0A8S1H5L6_9PELO|nr:unnamed protein product [Caenorhabditis auriculariae]